MFNRAAKNSTAAPAVATEKVLYGLMAEFDDADVLLAAATKTRDAGYKKIEAYTPIPVHGLDEAVGYKGTRLPWLIFAMGVFGATFMFLFQTWVNMSAYPINVGGRPLFSWQGFVPVTFEGMVLCAGLTAVFGMILFCGLPQPYHPVFNAPGFERASTDRFFLCVEAADGQFEEKRVREFLTGLGALSVSRVDE